MPGRRNLALVVFLSFVLIGVAGGSDDVSMVYADNLRQEAQQAREHSLVLMIEFSSADCPYCRELEEEFLLPMQRNAGYRQKVLIRAVSLDGQEPIVDFNGESISPSRFASRYQVMVTPTLIFVDAEGKRMSEDLVGIWSKDYFGGYIDARIDEAIAKL